MTASLSADDKDSVHYIYVCVKGEVAKVDSSTAPVDLTVVYDQGCSHKQTRSNKQDDTSTSISHNPSFDEPASSFLWIVGGEQPHCCESLIMYQQSDRVYNLGLPTLVGGSQADKLSSLFPRIPRWLMITEWAQS